MFNASSKERINILKCIQSLDIIECDKSKTVFNKEQRENIIDEYNVINEKTAKYFFKRKKLFLDDIETPNIKTLSDEVILSKYLPELIKKLASNI